MFRKPPPKGGCRARKLRNRRRIDRQWNKPDDEGGDGCSPDNRSYAVVFTRRFVSYSNCFFRLGRGYFDLEDHGIVMSAGEALLEVGEPVPEIDFILLSNFSLNLRSQL